MTKYTEISGDDGKATFREVPFGNYTLTVESDDFETYTQNITVNKSNNEPRVITPSLVVSYPVAVEFSLVNLDGVTGTDYTLPVELAARYGDTVPTGDLSLTDELVYSLDGKAYMDTRDNKEVYVSHKGDVYDATTGILTTARGLTYNTDTKILTLPDGETTYDLTTQTEEVDTTYTYQDHTHRLVLFKGSTGYFFSPEEEDIEFDGTLVTIGSGAPAIANKAHAVTNITLLLVNNSQYGCNLEDCVILCTNGRIVNGAAAKNFTLFNTTDQSCTISGSNGTIFNTDEGTGNNNYGGTLTGCTIYNTGAGTGNSSGTLTGCTIYNTGAGTGNSSSGTLTGCTIYNTGAGTGNSSGTLSGSTLYNIGEGDGLTGGSAQYESILINMGTGTLIDGGTAMGITIINTGSGTGMTTGYIQSSSILYNTGAGTGVMGGSFTVSKIVNTGAGTGMDLSDISGVSDNNGTIYNTGGGTGLVKGSKAFNGTIYNTGTGTAVVGEGNGTITTETTIPVDDTTDLTAADDISIPVVVGVDGTGAIGLYIADGSGGLVIPTLYEYTETLSSGSAEFTLPASTLTAGVHKITIDYPGDTSHKTGTNVVNIQINTPTVEASEGE